MTNIGEVIGWKFNHQEGMTTRNGVITEFPNGIPSQADQDKWTKEYEEYVSANAYKEKRRAEYPSIEDVTVALAEKAEGDSTMWDEITVKRQAIKAKYPKE